MPGVFQTTPRVLGIGYQGLVVQFCRKCFKFLRASRTQDGSEDVIVISRGKAPVLYRLDQLGEIHHLCNSVLEKRLVGAWLRWPDVSSLLSIL